MVTPAFAGIEGDEKEAILEDLTKYVNPFIGTDSFLPEGPYKIINPLLEKFWPDLRVHANTYPGAVVPFGMVQLSPDTRNPPLQQLMISSASLLGYNLHNVAGYHYGDSKIEGFSHTHVSGCGCPEYGNILLIPTTGPLEIDERGYASKFSHDSEVAYPGYYAVDLDDYGIRAELTATERCGFHRYTFPESEDSRILIDVTHALSQCENAEVEIVDQDEVAGWVTSGNFCGLGNMHTVYFIAQFSRPFSSFGTWNGNEIYTSSHQSGEDIGVFVDYSTYEGEVIRIKVGISFVNISQARKNLNAEIPHWSFDQVKNRAKEAWNNELNRIEVKGGTEEQTKFYTALYHSLLMPHIFSDVDGRYRGMDDRVHLADYTHYATFSLWDTFRAQHPLLTLVYPKRQSDMVRSLIDKYQRGGWFPKWPFANDYTNCMIGDHATSVIVDSYIKGIRDFDIEKAYKGMRKSAMYVPPRTAYTGRIGLKDYLELGYVSTETSQSVSRTLEFAYNDWCLAQIAKELGKLEDYEIFAERSDNYKNVFDTSTGFMRPRNSNGAWKKPFNPAFQGGFTEGSSWTYSWFVPHDVFSLIELMGGGKSFADKLDRHLKEFSSPIWFEPIIHYWHGNEPNHHAIYLYNYAGMPWRTQDEARRVLETQYGTAPGGLCGNDDCGQMSAWYVFSAMGFYPVCPGNLTYQIGSPIFDEVIIHLDSKYHKGERFLISADRVSKEGRYIKSATLNEEALKRPWIKHSEIVDGGHIIFEMDCEPNMEWGLNPGDSPFW